MPEPGWKKEARERMKDRKEGNTLKAEEGMNYFRLMQNKKGPDFAPYREFSQHFNVGPDKKSCTCGLDVRGRGRCWLCQVQIPILEASESRAKQAKAVDIAATERFLILACRTDQTGKKWSMPKPWFPSHGGTKSLSYSIQSFLLRDGQSVTDPVKGYRLVFERTGSGLATRYLGLTLSEHPIKVPDAILAAVKDLDSYIDPYDEEAMKAAYYGRPVEDEPETEKGYETEGEGESTEEPEVEGETDAEGEPEVEAEESGETEFEGETEAEEEPEIEPEIEDDPEEYVIPGEEPEPPKRTPRPAPKPTGKPAPKPAPRPAPKPAPPARPAPKPAPKPPAKRK